MAESVRKDLSTVNPLTVSRWGAGPKRAIVVRFEPKAAAREARSVAVV